MPLVVRSTIHHKLWASGSPGAVIAKASGFISTTSCLTFIINFWLQVAIVQALLKPQWVSNEPNQQSQSLLFKKSLPWPPSYTWRCIYTVTTKGFQISPIADILCGGVIAHFQAVRDVRPPFTSPSVDLRHPPAVPVTAHYHAVSGFQTSPIADILCGGVITTYCQSS